LLWYDDFAGDQILQMSFHNVDNEVTSLLYGNLLMVQIHYMVCVEQTSLLHEFLNEPLRHQIVQTFHNNTDIGRAFLSCVPVSISLAQNCMWRFCSNIGISFHEPSSIDTVKDRILWKLSCNLNINWYGFSPVCKHRCILKILLSANPLILTFVWLLPSMWT